MKNKTSENYLDYIYMHDPDLKWSLEGEEALSSIAYTFSDEKGCRILATALNKSY